MKRLGLTLSLLLAIFGLYILIYQFIPPVGFDWEDCIINLIIAGIIYITVLLIGNSLNKKFDSQVTLFIDGKQEKLSKDKGLFRTFGLLLITLLPYLLYLEILALYVTITVVLNVLIWVSYLPSVPIGFLIALAIILFGTALAVLIGFFSLLFPRRRKTLGIEVKMDEQKGLWKLARDVAAEIQAKPVDKIIVTPDSGIGVYLDGSILVAIFGRGKRVLEIGLPSIHGLSVDEFKAILGHEYGHFSNADIQWGAFTYAMGNALTNSLRSMPGPSQNKNGKGSMLALNPAYWILFIFVALYFRVTNGFSRIREVMADIKTMDLYGGKTFSNGLLRVATNDTVFTEVIQAQTIPDLLKQGKTISNFSKIMDVAYQSVDESLMQCAKEEILNLHKEHGAYDSHPALKVRIDYAAKFGQQEEKDTRLLASIFENGDNLNERIAELYNVRLLSYIRSLKKS